MIELSSYCKNDCYYCGLRASNTEAKRYRLSKEDILESCAYGYNKGFRTFVLQGGEDPYFSDELLSNIIETIKNKYPECAITLSLGERSFQSYKELKRAGADRYLLRHETITPTHYTKLHPRQLSLDNRIECLHHLMELGFQVGTGIMVGSPFQTNDAIANDLVFIQKLRPHMIGIGPFLPHSSTPFRDKEKGSLSTTLLLISLCRLMDKTVLIPATTALCTLDTKGRELGILAGANVIMPNISPMSVRNKYMLYDNKVFTDEEKLEETLKAIGYSTSVARGDNRRHNNDL